MTYAPAGWIKLHRKLIWHPLFKNPERLQMWLWLLCNATHTPRKVEFGGKEIELAPGQLTCGRKQIAAALGVSEWKVLRTTKCLETAHQISVVPSNACSLITITNWNEYQSGESEIAQPSHNHRTTTAQPPHTKQECKNMRIEEDGEGVPHRNFPETAADAIKQCEVAGINVPEQFIDLAWSKADYRGGRDSRGILITRFPSYAKVEWTYEQNRVAEGGSSATKGDDVPEFELRNQLELVRSEIKRIRDEGGYDAAGMFMGTDVQRQALKKLKEKEVNIRKRLGLT